MADNASLSTNTTPGDAPAPRTGTRQQHQQLEGQNHQLWNLTVTTDNLNPGRYNKIKQQMAVVASQLCKGNITHVLQVIEAGKDTVYQTHHDLCYTYRKRANRIQD